MIVDSASEVLKIPESDIEAAPAMMREGGLDCVTSLGKYQGRLILLLEIEKVLAAAHQQNEPSTTEKMSEKAGPAAADGTPARRSMASPALASSPGTGLQPQVRL